ncbi:hypothetical protein Alsa2_CDS0131 [Staphylococcus phage Alsa_2]|nr:hypothetical protein Alsa2_CDS0131 [Staphylococcus phage Alsa_2]
MENIIVKKIDKTYGGYDYLEFNQETREYTTGNSRAHMGHASNNFPITVGTKKELNQRIEMIQLAGYKEIETFGRL